MNTETECERVLAYMGERYEDSFTCPVYYGSYSGTSFHQYYLKAEKLDGAEVMLEIYGGGTPQERYLDNYMGVKYRPQLKEVLKDVLISGCRIKKDDVCVILGSDKLGLSDHWTSSTSLEEYCGDPAAGISFTAVVRGEVNYLDPIRRRVFETLLEDELIERRICCSGWIYFVKKDVELAGMTEGSFFDLILKHACFKARLHFNMKTSDGVEEFAWAGGRMGVDGPEIYQIEPVEPEAAMTAADSDD